MRFQVSLTTAIALMLAAAIILWANLAPTVVLGGIVYGSPLLAVRIFDPEIEQAPFVYWPNVYLDILAAASELLVTAVIVRWLRTRRMPLVEGSTWIACGAVAGVLIRINLATRSTILAAPTRLGYWWGWPFDAWIPEWNGGRASGIQFAGFIADLAVGITMIWIVGWAAEFIVRRRRASNAASNTL